VTRQPRTLLLLTACWLLTLLPRIAAAELRPFTADYSLSRGYLLLAHVRVTLRIDADGRYRYRAHTLPVGVTAVLRSDEITESSEGMIIGREIRPDSYLYRHDKRENPRQVQLRFDWQQLRVLNQTPSSNWSMAVTAGTQDKFSQQLALMQALATGRRELEMSVADGGRLKRYRYQFQQMEPVITPAGEFDTLKLTRQKDQRRSQASLWLAPALGYLPVRVERRERDGVFEMELDALSWE